MSETLQQLQEEIEKHRVATEEAAARLASLTLQTLAEMEARIEALEKRKP